MNCKIIAYVLNGERNVNLLLQALINNEKLINIVRTSLNFTKAVKKVKEKKPDLLIVNTNAHDISNVGLGKILPSMKLEINLVSLTKHQKSACEPIKYGPFDILGNPITSSQVQGLINRLFKHIKEI